MPQQLPLLESKPEPGGYSSPYRDGLPGHHSPGGEKSETELEAAKNALERAGEVTLRVLEFLIKRKLEGATYTEVQDALGVASAQQRLSDLVQRGLVVDSGERRKTPRGSRARVWVIR